MELLQPSKTTTLMKTSERKMKIREYASDDYKVCKEIISESTSQINEEYSDEELEHLEEVIPDMVTGFAEKERFSFYIAEKPEEVVGVAGYNLNGKIAGIFIHPDHQREGIGRRLMQEMETKAKEEEDIQEFVASASLTAEKFYEKLGFQKIKKKDSEMDGKDIPVYKMEKEL